MLRVDRHILRVDRPFQRFWETMSCSINYFKNVQMLNFFNETPQLPTKKVPKNLFNAASIFKWWSFPKSSKGKNVVLIFIRFCRFFLWDTAIISILASIFSTAMFSTFFILFCKIKPGNPNSICPAVYLEPSQAFKMELFPMTIFMKSRNLRCFTTLNTPLILYVFLYTDESSGEPF